MINETSQISSTQRSIIAITLIGNAIEWFEFSLFGLMAPFFLYIFLPPSLNASSIIFPVLMTLSVLARPFGGVFFGRMGDKKGRKSALIRTIYFLIFPLLLTAFLPSYEEAGLFSFSLLILIFILQGFILGGEFPGSIVYLVESAKNKTKGYIGSWAYFGCFCGMFFASLEFFLLTSLIFPKNLTLFSWRSAFLFTAIIAVITGFSRYLLPETAPFKRTEDLLPPTKTSLLKLCHKYKNALLCGMGLIVLETVGMNMLILFSSDYLLKEASLTTFQVATNQMTVVLTFMVAVLISSKASIYYGHEKIAKWSIYALLLFAFLAPYLVSLKFVWLIYVTHVVMAFFFASYLGNIPALICSIFPTEIRFTAVALACNISVMIFSTIELPIISFFVHNSSSILWPGFIWFFGALLSLWAISKVKNFQIH